MFKRKSKSSVGIDKDELAGISPVFLSPFFYGRISRNAAETILLKRGQKDGSYLLRESIHPMGNFSLTVVHKKKCNHYSIEKQVDGLFMIAGGKKFKDPLDLIQHYSCFPGCVSYLEYPCPRLATEEAIAFTGISYDDLHRHMDRVARNMNASMLRVLGPLRDTLMIHVLRTMHESLPWYHGEISREEAVDRLNKSGMEDGNFLVRIRTGGESFVLTMIHEGNVKNYIITKLYGESYQIQKGPSFKALIILIDFYHNRKDGLVCSLTMPCCEPNYKASFWNNYKRLCQMYEASNTTSDEPNNLVISSPVAESIPSGISASAPPLNPTTEENLSDNEAGYEDPDDLQEELVRSPLAKSMSKEEAQDLENVYGDIRTTVQTCKLRPEHITIIKKLGSGQFGEVMKGKCVLGGTEIPVAIKTLKNQDGENEIRREANLMKKLDHKHIVRMIGVCKAESIMLVMELAESGPLKTFLKSHRLTGLRHWHLIELMLQICEGMVYLESKDVVHRDLATRNVLLLNAHFVKISDFGMSRIMDRETNYYAVQGPAGKWPLMWYAPECIYYLKFDCKSDVWSFGVTMWEIMSYAARPYPSMVISNIMQFLESGYRMAKPKDCDPRIYAIMMRCWDFKKQQRPSFIDIHKMLEPFYREFKYQDL